MSDNTAKDKVLDLLNTWMVREQRIALLRYEMEYPAHVSADDVIDALAFGHRSHEGSTTGHISNKTLYIALNYQEEVTNNNAAILDEIAVQLYKLERQQERLDHYIALLPKREADILRLSFRDGNNNRQIGEMLGITSRTVRSCKAHAVDHLCELYSYTAEIQHI